MSDTAIPDNASSKPNDYGSSTAPGDVALAYCDKEINFYDGVYHYNQKRWKIWQRTAITSGVLGTLLATMPNLLPYRGIDYWPLIRATPVALASIATAFLSSFRYQADALRQGSTSDLLQGEAAKFRCSAEPYNLSDAENISAFMRNIRAIIGTEQRQWISQGANDQQGSQQSKPNI